MKKCNDCLQEKPLTDFYKCAANSDGRRGKCIVCYKAKRKITMDAMRAKEKSIPKSKFCGNCQQNKLSTEFKKVDYHSDGLSSHCKLCIKSQEDARYERNKIKNASSDVPNEKTCSKCGTLKPANDFHKSARNTDGLSGWCVGCRSKDDKKNRKTITQYNIERYHKKLKYNPQHKLTRNLRARVRSVITKCYKSAKTIELLGCSVEHVKTHLESQFTPEMTWENYGSYWHVDHILPCSAFDLTDPSHQKACFNWANLQPLEADKNVSKGAKHCARELNLYLAKRELYD